MHVPFIRNHVNKTSLNANMCCLGNMVQCTKLCRLLSVFLLFRCSRSEQNAANCPLWQGCIFCLLTWICTSEKIRTIKPYFKCTNQLQACWNKISDRPPRAWPKSHAQICSEWGKCGMINIWTATAIFKRTPNKSASLKAAEHNK